MLFRRRIQPSGSALLRPDGFALHSSAVFFWGVSESAAWPPKKASASISLKKRKPTVMTTESPEQIIKPELRVTCSTFRIAAVVQKAGAIQNSADARQEYCS